jgi:hypothetical protein
MKKVISAVLGGVMLSVAAVGFTAPANAQSGGFGPFGFGYSDNDGYNDDWRWRRHHRADRRAYYNDDYRYRRHHGNYYRYRDRDHDFGGAAAATIFGLAAGAIVGGIAAGAGDDDSYYRCQARYRSFDPDSWTYLGYDGDRHYCRL